MDTLLQDLRYAVRQLARTPAFTLVAALTLAIGIGANTALFTMLEAIFVRPLPGVENHQGLVWITPYNKFGGHPLNLSYPDFADYRDSSGVFAQAAAFGRADLSVASGDSPVRVNGAVVSGNFFSLLGVRMAKGRGFTQDEDQTPGTHPVAVVSHRMWQTRLNGDADVVGRQVVINGLAFTVVGVTPERFNGVEHNELIEIYVPMMMQQRAIPQFGDMLQKRGSWWLKAVGQLKSDVSIERAKMAVATVAARLVKIDSVDHANVSALVAPVTGGVSPSTGRDVYPIAILGAAATGLILLICCANVSNMLLARAVGRRREIGVRLSLGASRRRIIRQLLTEAALLSFAAAALGFVLALWATDLLANSIPAPLEISPDRNTATFAIIVSVFTGVFFGLVPALHATRGDLTAALKEAALGRDRRRSRLQGGFVVAQISLSLVLLVMAGMFLSSLYRSTKVDVGFEATSHVLAASFDLGLQDYSPERATAFANDVQQRVAAIPGVVAVSMTNSVPMGERRIGGTVSFENSESPTSRSERGVDVYDNVVRPEFFRTLGIGIVRGREFLPMDMPGSEPVAIVSEDLARQAWPGADPIGKRISLEGPKGKLHTVVGVAREAITYGLSERRRPTVYRSQLQLPRVRDLTLLVRTTGDAAQLARPIVNMIHELDANLPVYDVQTLGRYRRDRMSEPALGSTLLAIVGALALMLACIGVYSVIAFSVGQRTREIGLRLAIGAVDQQVVRLFLREGLRLTAFGLGVGLALSAALAKVLSSAFMGVSAIDSLAFVGVALLLAGIAALASWIPARRAAAVDPMVALRTE
jgi:putative ABC transport system permease protein